MNLSCRLLTVIIAMGVLPSVSKAQTTTDASTTGNKLTPPKISAEYPFESRFVPVLGSRIHYVESGTGDAIVFIHGNPTSSYLWRNVIPYVIPYGRAIALDLIGMGKSDKPDIDYRFSDHYRYVEGFIEKLRLGKITLVIHDWGAALGFEYARRHPDRVKAIAFMEGVLPPSMPQPSFEAMGEEMGGMFRAFKDPELGIQMVIRENKFVVEILPNLVNRNLSVEERAAYLAPFQDEPSRKPVLVWPREVPIAGEPKENVETMHAIGAFMEQTDIPMLVLYAYPGILIPPAAVP